MSKLASAVSKPLSNIDLDNLLKDINKDQKVKHEKVNIFTVPEMYHHPQYFLDQLFKHHYCILFLENEGTNIGHWIMMFEAKKILFVFDSYGNHPDDLNKELTTFLRKLKPKYFKDIRYNVTTYQKYGRAKNGEPIATCGRWAMFIVGLRKLIGDDLTLDKVDEILEDLKKRNKIDYDTLMAKMVNFDK